MKSNARYLSNILFEKIGKKGQEKISKAKITIIGLGALGTNSAELLTRAGIGTLNLIDRDIVESSNLQRQTLFTEQDIGEPKAIIAKSALERINSKIKISSHFKDINHKTISMIKPQDLILDCTDNMNTRFLLDEYCYKNNQPWIYTGIIESSGMVFKIVPNKTLTLKEIFQETLQPTTGCDLSGVLNTTATFASSIQVTETLKHIVSKSISHELLFFDIWKNQIKKITIKKKKDFKQNYEYLNGKNDKKAIHLCGNNSYQLRGPKLKLKEVAKKLERINENNSELKLTPHCLIFRELTIFNDGRVLIKEKTEERAKAIYTKYIGY